MILLFCYAGVSTEISSAFLPIAMEIFAEMVFCEQSDAGVLHFFLAEDNIEWMDEWPFNSVDGVNH